MHLRIQSQEPVDPVHRIKQVAQRTVMVERVNDQCDELAQITAMIVGLREKLRFLVDQVCRENRVEDLLLPCLVKLLKPVREQSEGCADEDPPGPERLQLFRDLQSGISG